MKPLIMVFVLMIQLFANNTDKDLNGSDIQMNILNATTNDDAPVFTNAKSQAYLKQEQKKKQEKPPVNETPFDYKAYEDALILNNIKLQNKTQKVIQKSTAFYEASDSVLKEQAKAQESKKIEADKNKKKKSKFIKATCLIPYNVQISLKDFMKINCQVENNKELIEVYGTYLADTKNFMLIGKIDSAIIDGEMKKVSTTSYMTNSFETSFNLATTVNTYAIENINMTLAKNTSKAIADEGKSVLGDIKDSTKNSTIAYDQNGNVYSTSANTKPSSSDITERIFYSLTVGALDGISQIMGEFKEKLPYLYSIQKGTLLKAFIYLEEDN